MKRTPWLCLLLVLWPLTALANPASSQLCAQAKAKMENGDLNGACQDFTRAIQADPKDTYAYCGRAGARIWKGQLDESLADISKSMAIDPKYAFAYMYRAKIEGMKGNLDDALADYCHAIDLDPNMLAAYSGRADVKRIKGDYSGAFTDSVRAEQLKPHPAWDLIGSLQKIEVIDGVGLEVDPPEPTVGQEMTLFIKLQGVTLGRMFDLPRVDGLEFMEMRNHQSQSKMQNGETNSWEGLAYTLYPKRAGDFTIPSWDARVRQDQIFHIPALHFHVKDVSSVPPSPVSAPASASSPAPDNHD